MRAEKETHHVIVYVWINSTLCVYMFVRHAFGTSACLLCFCPRLSLTATFSIRLWNPAEQTKKGAIAPVVRVETVLLHVHTFRRLSYFDCIVELSNYQMGWSNSRFVFVAGVQSEMKRVGSMSWNQETPKQTVTVSENGCWIWCFWRIKLAYIGFLEWNKAVIVNAEGKRLPRETLACVICPIHIKPLRRLQALATIWCGRPFPNPAGDQRAARYGLPSMSAA